MTLNINSNQDLIHEATLLYWEVSVIVGNKDQSQYCKWPSLAIITRPFYSVNKLVDDGFGLLTGAAMDSLGSV